MQSQQQQELRRQQELQTRPPETDVSVETHRPPEHTDALREETPLRMRLRQTPSLDITGTLPQTRTQTENPGKLLAPSLQTSAQVSPISSVTHPPDLETVLELTKYQLERIVIPYLKKIQMLSRIKDKEQFVHLNAQLKTEMLGLFTASFAHVYWLTHGKQRPDLTVLCAEIFEKDVYAYNTQTGGYSISSYYVHMRTRRLLSCLSFYHRTLPILKEHGHTLTGSMGSDFHNDGAHVLKTSKMVKGINTPFVFKPRSVAADNLFGGADSPLLHKMGLMSIEYEEVSDSAGFVEFLDDLDMSGGSDMIVKRAVSTIHTESHARTIAEDLGKIAAICTAYGIVDMHPENLVMSRGRMIMIDIETSMLTTPVQGKEMMGDAPSRFLAAMQEKSFTTSDGEIKTGLTLDLAGTFRTAFEYGMLAVHENDMLLLAFQKIRKARILSIATSALSNKMCHFQATYTFPRSDVTEGSVRLYMGDIQKRLSIEVPRQIYQLSEAARRQRLTQMRRDFKLGEDVSDQAVIAEEVNHQCQQKGNKFRTALAQKSEDELREEYRWQCVTQCMSEILGSLVKKGYLPSEQLPNESIWLLREELTLSFQRGEIFLLSVDPSTGDITFNDNPEVFYRNGTYQETLRWNFDKACTIHLTRASTNDFLEKQWDFSRATFPEHKKEP